MSEPASQRWGMVIDLNRCVGCQTCTAACKHANDTVPGVQWRRVLDVETGTFPDVERLFLVVGCQHCAEPPCVPVCPSGATAQRADGLVTMDYDRCIGCASCALACPYQARTIAHGKQWYYGEETVQESHVFHDERMGVAQKCSFCIERIDDAPALGMTPGVDFEVTPACATSCITQAIRFGDFKDPESNVSKLIRDNSSFQMHAELGCDPQIKYLYETPAVPGREPGAQDTSEAALLDPANPLVGRIQTFWDYRAAMNFIMGGFGAGLVITVFALFLFTGLPDFAVTGLYATSGVVIAVGLFFVWLKIGRKLRAPYALLRPQSSWMTREIYAVGVFYAAAIADLIWPGAALHAVTAAGALAFLYCQTRILHVCKGIPSWRVPLMPALLVATGLYEGTGLFALIAAVYPVPAAAVEATAGLALVMALVNAALWNAYRQGLKNHGVGPVARGVVQRLTPWLHAIGHGVPFLLFLGLLVRPGLPAGVLALAGLLVLTGGALWKATVITRAGQQQGFALAKYPRRGSGALAAPPLPRAAEKESRAAQ